MQIRIEMKRAMLVVALIILFSILAGTVLLYWFGWPLKKTIIITGGAALAMIVFDVVIPSVRTKKQKVA